MRTKSIKIILFEIRAPLSLLTAFLILILCERLSLIPSFEQMVEWLRRLYDNYGFWIVFPVSLLENCTIVNFIFPGAIVILSAMAMAAGDIMKGIYIFIMIWIGSLIGLFISYFIGRFFPSPDKVSSQVLDRNLYLRCLGAFWHPQVASMACYDFGIRHVKMRLLIPPLLLSNFLWNLFWGVTVYSFGNFFDDAASIKHLVLFLLFIWLLVSLYKSIRTSPQVA